MDTEGSQTEEAGRRYEPLIFFIGGLLIVILACKVFATTSHGSYLPRVRGDFSTISSAIKMYQVETGRLPREKEGLEVLVERPSGFDPKANWQKLMNEVPVNPWGRPYHYVRIDRAPGGFGIYSSGSDGISRSNGYDDDDLRSWDAQ